LTVFGKFEITFNRTVLLYAVHVYWYGLR